MTRVQTILTNARGALSDPDKERWTDARLLSLLSKAQIHFATKSRLFINTSQIVIQLNNADYELPGDAFLLIRVVGPDGRIPLISSYELDRKDPDWQTRTGERIENIVYDLKSPGKFKIFPVITQQPEAAPYEFDSLYGVAVSLDTTECVEINDQYGVISDTDVFMAAQYIRIPARLEADTDELEVPYVYDDVLENYVVAHAFRDDLDTQHRTLGAEYLALYNDGLNDAKDAHMSSNTEANTANTTTRRFF